MKRVSKAGVPRLHCSSYGQPEEPPAEFVVTEFGRADVGSLRIISTTNDAFAESIRRALPRMRFRAAKIGDREVSQLVRQNFVFRLDR